MKKFNFYIDRKVIVWKRDCYWIEAATEEEAIAKIKEKHAEGDLDGWVDNDEGIHWDEQEYLSDYETYLEPDENVLCLEDIQATEEIYFSTLIEDEENMSVGLGDDIKIWDNKPKAAKRAEKLSLLGL